MLVYLLTEHIGFERITRGTETSKYPEEKKSTEIALVAASERGRGQTESSNTFGVRTADGMLKVSRRTWDGPPKRVKVSYAKTESSQLNPEYRRTRETRWEYGGTILQA